MLDCSQSLFFNARERKSERSDLGTRLLLSRFFPRVEQKYDKITTVYLLADRLGIYEAGSDLKIIREGLTQENRTLLLLHYHHPMILISDDLS